MSVTTTSNPLTHTVQSILTDYELHHSTPNDQPVPPPNETPILRSSNPPTWPENHRRVPHYRPVNRDLDQSERRVYQNPIERAFITTMFTGLYMNVIVARIWRGTGGRFNDKIFHYKIGGEW